MRYATEVSVLQYSGLAVLWRFVATHKKSLSGVNEGRQPINNDVLRCTVNTCSDAADTRARGIACIVPAPLTYVHRTPTRPRTTHPRSEPSRGQGGLATRVSSRKDLRPRVGERGERASIRQVPPLPLPHAWVHHPQDQARPGLRTEVVPIRTPAKGTSVSGWAGAASRESAVSNPIGPRRRVHDKCTMDGAWCATGSMHAYAWGCESLVRCIPSCTACLSAGGHAHLGRLRCADENHVGTKRLAKAQRSLVLR